MEIAESAMKAKDEVTIPGQEWSVPELLGQVPEVMRNPVVRFVIASMLDPK